MKASEIRAILYEAQQLLDAKLPDSIPYLICTIPENAQSEGILVANLEQEGIIDAIEFMRQSFSRKNFAKVVERKH